MTLPELHALFLAHPRVATDTRACPPDSIFFALRGEHFDGNRFALDALRAGCCRAVVDDPATARADERCILVADALGALQDLARHHRIALGTPILQITGTNGKTTTKELVAAVLAEQYRVHYTQGNLNNHIGVPLTLLALTAAHQVAVVETGANHVGEIAALSNIVLPDCGLVTNVGAAHLEGFGSLEGVIRTKTELYEHLRQRTTPPAAAHAPGSRPNPGLVFLPAGNTLLAPHAKGLPAVTYGAPGSGSDIEGEAVECAPFLHFRWRTKEGQWHLTKTRLIGAYNLENGLAAVAVGWRFGIPPAKICAAIARYAPRNQRSEFRTTEHNRLVVDAYNANLSSMRAAIDNFRAFDAPGKMMILGEMRELGTASASAHAEVAQQAAAAGCQAVWFVGEGFAQAAQELAAQGHAEVLHFPDVAAVESHLAQHPLRDRLILIKGSNATRLSRLPERL